MEYPSGGMIVRRICSSGDIIREALGSAVFSIGC
jgi:hypothetical protein